jgi:hypothetical protein
LSQEEIRAIVQEEIWKVPILDFWMGIVFENLGEFWHGMEYPEFFKKLPQHVGKLNEPNWALLKLNV